MRLSQFHRKLVLSLWLTTLGLGWVMAQDAADNPVETGQEGVMSYPADFFRRYQPNTALDMVQRVPGFTLDDGGGLRGLAGRPVMC